MRSKCPTLARIETSADAERMLLSLVRTHPRPYQSRAEGDPQAAIRRLLEQLGNPQRGLPCIHIAGSKGKGSTALLLESMLRAGGVRVGTYTSPHLQRWTERIRVAGQELSVAEFIALMERLRGPVQRLHQEDPQQAPGFFDVLTAAALLAFAARDLDCAIVETGLGGRLDATRIVDARVCCITSIELEHTDKLGDNLVKIATEKAGIIRPGVVVIIGRLPNAAATLIQDSAMKQSAPLLRLGHEFDVTSTDTASFRQTLSLSLPGGLQVCCRGLPVPGIHMAHNTALAAACALESGLLDRSQAGAAIARGVAEVSLPGRLELLAQQPAVLVDAAHTPDSCRALAEVLQRWLPGRIHLLVSLSGQRQPAILLAPLLVLADAVFVTRADPQRSMPPQQLATSIRAQHPTLAVQVVEDPRHALAAARRGLAPEDILCIGGSTYLAGTARAILESGK